MCIRDSQYLSRSYWAKDRSLETVQQAINGSLTFGLFYKNQQIGMARVVTDTVIMAYLADVYILEEFRGKDLGKWLIETIVNYEPLKEIKNFILHTKDAHGLYEQFGFKNTEWPERIMEKRLQ